MFYLFFQSYLVFISFCTVFPFNFPLLFSSAPLHFRCHLFINFIHLLVYLFGALLVLCPIFFLSLFFSMTFPFYSYFIPFPHTMGFPFHIFYHHIFRFCSFSLSFHVFFHSLFSRPLNFPSHVAPFSSFFLLFSIVLLFYLFSFSSVYHSHCIPSIFHQFHSYFQDFLLILFFLLSACVFVSSTSVVNMFSFS